MKISVITAVYNRRETIADAVRSLQAQTYEDFEHIVADGASTDGTLDVLYRLADRRTDIVSEPDHGIYDALNKAIARARGDVVGVLHSDDVFAGTEILAHVAQGFTDSDVDAVYGDLQYVSSRHAGRVIRHWRSGDYTPARLKRGWMPPHPALFVRKGVIERWGAYDTSYRIAADYDAILRWFGSGQLKAAYVPEVFVRMKAGGASNKSLRAILRKSAEDYRALKHNGVGGWTSLALKNLSKLPQFALR